MTHSDRCTWTCSGWWSTLNQVHLTITAQQGSGNLLGNLLCAVAHLLDNTGNITAPLTNLLNQILAVLGRL